MKIPRSEMESVLKLEPDLAFYGRGILAMGPARGLEGISKREFIEVALHGRPAMFALITERRKQRGPRLYKFAFK